MLDAGYIKQETGLEDRRQRLLYPTQSGRKLILKLSLPQSRRIRTALEKSSTIENPTISDFLRHMTDTNQGKA